MLIRFVVMKARTDNKVFAILKNVHSHDVMVRCFLWILKIIEFRVNRTYRDTDTQLE